MLKHQNILLENNQFIVTGFQKKLFLPSVFLFIFSSQTGSHYVAQASLELMICLPHQPPE
jgi:hypothetical protein